jgi:hypothetical protein
MTLPVDEVLRRSVTSPPRTRPHCGLGPSRTGLPQQAKACWRSPGLVHVVSFACAGSNDYAGPVNHSRVTRLPCCLPPTQHGVGILNCDFSKLNHPAHQCLCSTLQAPPHDDTCKTRGQDGFATSFPVGLFHPLQHAGLSRRSLCSRQCGHYTGFGVTSGWAVILPQLAKTCRMTCESISMNGLAISSPTESACGDKLTDKSCS